VEARRAEPRSIVGRRGFGAREEDGEASAETAEGREKAAEDAKCDGRRHVVILEEIEQAQAEDGPGMEHGDGGVKALGDQGLQLVARVSAGEVHGAEEGLGG
jgi:hypothetical protein